LIAAAWQSGWPAYPSYGLTETASQITGLTRDDVHTRRGSSGHPILPTEIAIRIGDRLAPANQPGDIWVRGPTVSPGYWDNPEETQRTFQQGWLKTGDIGYLDRDGYLTVLDRRADLIITGGENVYPSEVESILTRHPAVVDAGVFGLPDPEWGQRVAAAVVARQPVSASDLQLHSKRFLAAYKVPTVYFWVESIPRTASGKILRRVLRKRIGNQARWER
jgi:O-succinylbenzoic acid--CoA ligase